MAEPYFPEKISDRKADVLMHYIEVLATDSSKMHYIKSEEYIYDLFPIDIVVFEPVGDYKFYTIATVGLSEYRFDSNFSRTELIMTLPINWKPIFDKEEYYWAPQLLRDIAYCIKDRNVGANVGQVYMLVENDGQQIYSDYTDYIGGILTFAENYELAMYEREYEEAYTRFLQVVPITKYDIQKIEEVGPLQFIQFNLHDSEGPLMVAKLKEKQVEGIDKLIKQNETALKGTDDNK